jgi:hypothetical protein
LCGFAPPHFCSPGLCFAKPLFGLQKRRQPFIVIQHFFAQIVVKSSPNREYIMGVWRLIKKFIFSNIFHKLLDKIFIGI